MADPYAPDDPWGDYPWTGAGVSEAKGMEPGTFSGGTYTVSWGGNTWVGAFDSMKLALVRTADEVRDLQNKFVSLHNPAWAIDLNLPTAPAPIKGDVVNNTTRRGKPVRKHSSDNRHKPPNGGGPPTFSLRGLRNL